MRKLVLFVSLVLMAFAVSTIVAEPTVEGTYLDQNVQVAYDPLGLQLGTKLFCRMQTVSSPRATPSYSMMSTRY